MKVFVRITGIIILLAGVVIFWGNSSYGMIVIVLDLGWIAGCESMYCLREMRRTRSWTRHRLYRKQKRIER